VSVLIDLNSDLGESFGAYRIGDDESLLEVVSSANVACGFHAGDPSVMGRTVRACVEKGVAVGAHPSYPDLQGFGRRNMAMTPDEVYQIMVYQLGALMGFCRANGTELRHVKPHGALYNQAAKDPNLAQAISQAIRDVDKELILLGLAGSAFEEAARQAGIPFAEEAFADRAYNPDGTLVPRSQPGAVIHDPAEAVSRTVEMALNGRVKAVDGSWVQMRPHSICVHGDTREASALASSIAGALSDAGIRTRPLREVLGL